MKERGRELNFILTFKNSHVMLATDQILLELHMYKKELRNHIVF